ncbi:MAG: VWA domain-containing protein [Candidatus Thiodiazotropha taylori]|nr:VWA domain-containing protein [Candidatus Thiodiazotropha taylori]
MSWFKSVPITIAVIIFSATTLAAPQARPLLMEGKQSLYQRVLSKPGAQVFSQVQQGSGSATAPFSVYYVYDRKQQQGSDWIQVGLSRHGTIEGWIPEIDTIPWNQGLTVAFRDPLGSDRVLLFNEKHALKEVIEDQSSDNYRALYTAAETGKLTADSPVVAIQPRTHIDILKDFYLVPIRDHEDIYIGSEQARMLQISSVPLQPIQQPAKKKRAEAKSEPKRQAFRSAVVFVIDSTLSMDPYIDRTREAVRKIYDTITKEDLTGDVSFGLVAFRDNPDAAPGLEYLTETYVDLDQGQNADSFFSQVSTLKAATVSSRDFKEDSYAGVNEAIAGIDWQNQDARYVVLITDAGPREAGDPLSGTGLSSSALRSLAQNKGIALSVLHLLTPSVMADHADAEETYRDLSYYPGIGSFYFGVETGNVERFGRVLDALAQQITEQVKLAAMAAAGKMLAEERQAKQAETEQAEANNDQLAQFQAKVAKLGYALRMRYLQQDEKQQVPSIFNAWLVDRDIQNPQRQTLDVRVLLTRDQLSDLHTIMRQVLITAEEGLLSPRSFLNDLKSLAATIARDPDQLGTTTRATGAREGNLADMGFMREYIEDLPYTGEVMNLSLEHWQDWPAKDQIEFINRLEEKINYYQVLHDHTDLWVSLDGGPVSGDSVFPIGLEMLP